MGLRADVGSSIYRQAQGLAPSVDRLVGDSSPRWRERRLKAMLGPGGVYMYNDAPLLRHQ